MIEEKISTAIPKTLGFVVSRLIRYLIIISAVMTGLSCNESLPSYSKPVDFLQGSVRNLGLPDVQYSHVDVNDISKVSVSIYSPPQIFFVDIVNTFDETIQDNLDVSGTLELICDEIPSINVTLKLSQTNLMGLHYNPKTKLLTLNPGDTLKLRVAWQYKTNEGRWGFQNVDIESETGEPGAKFTTRTHKQILYKVKTKIKIFKQVGPLLAAPSSFFIKYSGSIRPPA